MAKAVQVGKTLKYSPQSPKLTAALLRARQMSRELVRQTQADRQSKKLIPDTKGEESVLLNAKNRYLHLQV